MKFIIGPCVIESQDVLNEVAIVVSSLARKYPEHEFYFKSSFDKANRTALNSFRGPGLEKGLEMLKLIKEKYDLKLLTDVHETAQVKSIARVVDCLQIPAFLCRQTDLIVESAKSGVSVNIKKGQFMSGTDMIYSYNKALESGCKDVWLTERGNTFGYNNLVVDFRNLSDMKKITEDVVMDCTHSVQRPSQGGITSGNREFVPSMALSALMWGVRSFFIETHPNPDDAKSDAANMLRLSELELLIDKLDAHSKI